ncbi:hypothetical protein KAR91_07660 [Candidatus Pacearchaeota archaeon]|nr:hypothetical protein [Candidatus Pacearchaeota archaeon]
MYGFWDSNLGIGVGITIVMVLVFFVVFSMAFGIICITKDVGLDITFAELEQCRIDAARVNLNGSEAIYGKACEWNQHIISKQAHNKASFFFDWTTSDRWNEIKLIELRTD